MKKKVTGSVRLNQVALDIEFLLISVIQGVALAALATAASQPLVFGHVETWPYILAAFLFILIFWSGAIIHAVSFIDWPIDLYHSFLYFLASVIEIIAITNLSDPLLWFLFLFMFQFVALVLYWYDLKMIKSTKHTFAGTKAGMELYQQMVSSQQKELFFFIPSSLLFNAAAVTAFVINAELFLSGGYHLVFILFQIIFGSVFLLQEVVSFKKRSRLLVEVDQ